MKFKLFPRNLFAAAFAALFLTLAGCGTAAPLSPDGDAASSEADSSVFPSVSSAEPLTDGTDASAAPTTAPAETGETESAQPTEAPQKEKKGEYSGQRRRHKEHPERTVRLRCAENHRPPYHHRRRCVHGKHHRPPDDGRDHDHD